MWEPWLVLFRTNFCPPRLAIHILLFGEWQEIVSFLAIVCSSWVPVNRGSTWRSIMTPRGSEEFPHVRKSNKLTSTKGWGSVGSEQISGMCEYP